MLKTVPELLVELGEAIRVRRVGQNWSQSEAARRAGMGLRTWQRLEARGQATTEHLVRAAIALRCEDTLGGLFPVPAPASMDALLKQQKVASKAKARASPRRARKAVQATGAGVGDDGAWS